MRALSIDFNFFTFSSDDGQTGPAAAVLDRRALAPRVLTSPPSRSLSLPFRSIRPVPLALSGRSALLTYVLGSGHALFANRLVVVGVVPGGSSRTAPRRADHPTTRLTAPPLAAALRSRRSRSARPLHLSLRRRTAPSRRRALRACRAASVRPCTCSPSASAATRVSTRASRVGASPRRMQSLGQLADLEVVLSYCV